MFVIPIVQLLKAMVTVSRCRHPISQVAPVRRSGSAQCSRGSGSPGPGGAGQLHVCCVIVFASVRRISQAARNRPESGMSAQTSVKYVEGGRQMNERRDNHARGGPT